MPIPSVLAGKLSLPVIGAPMFLVSTPPLVAAQCKAGIVGAFPHVNARPSEQLDAWLTQLTSELAAWDAEHPEAPSAPYSVNLIVHKTNPRYEPDLALVVKHKVPIVITALGHPGKVVEAVHSYGGIVLCDVINAEHAKKSIAAGVDGIIAVGAGAGGHAGTTSPLVLVRELREFWKGLLVLGGAIGDGYQVRAAEVLGADLAYVGTRFIATKESAAQDEYKAMLVASGVKDLVYSDRFSGVHANFLLPSITRHGIEVEKLPPKSPDVSGLADSNAKAWKDIWSAGHGVATIHDVPSVSELVERMTREYREACAMGVSAAVRR